MRVGRPFRPGRTLASAASSRRVVVGGPVTTMCVGAVARSGKRERGAKVGRRVFLSKEVGDGKWVAYLGRGNGGPHIAWFIVAPWSASGGLVCRMTSRTVVVGPRSQLLSGIHCPGLR